MSAPRGRGRWGAKLARAAGMPPGEILLRARQAGTTLRERLLASWGLRPAGEPGLRPARAPFRFYFDPADRRSIVADLERHHPDWIRRAEARAARVLGDPWYADPRWGADPAGGKEWPRRFFADLDISSGDLGHGDVRVLWELNRHRALVDLAKAWFLTGNEACRRRCRELLLDSWRPQNPYGIGINWTSALEVGMRVLAWTWIYFFLGGRDGLVKEDAVAILTGLHEHGVYLERHLSLYFSPNNHLVGEATALYLLGIFAEAIPRAARWERLGWDILARQAERQFHEDGGSSEQATCYHHYTLCFYYQAVVLRRLRGQEVAPALWERLERATRFTCLLTRPDGRVPMIGDNDDAVAFPAGEGPGWDFRHVLAAGAVLFGRPGFRWAAESFSELAYWLLGPGGRQSFESLPAEAPRERSVALPRSGYCVMRDAWDETSHYLCLDCGPLAAGVPRNGASASAHGHADALALEIAAHGRPMVVDPGCPSYNTEPDWLRHFRGTWAHNTWVVDGASQSEPAGRLRWRYPAEARLESWITTDWFDYVRAAHDGFERLPGRVRHVRAVIFAPSWGWIVRDRLEGSGRHRLETRLQFDPAASVEAWHDGLLATSGEARLAIWLLADRVLLPGLARGGRGPDHGWVATSYAEREPAWTARYALSADLPATLWQVHRPSRGTMPPLTVSRRFAHGVEALRIAGADDAHLLLHSEPPGSPFTLGPLASDAWLLWLSRAGRTGEVQVKIVEARFLRWETADLWRSERRSHGRARLPGLPPDLGEDMP